MIDFDQAFSIMITPDFENNTTTKTSGDLGGKTRCGLTQFNYSAFRLKQGLPAQDIELAEMDEIKKWYQIYAWNNAGCDQIFGMGNDKLSFVHFNCSVQRGYVKSVVTLQDAIGMPYENQTGFFGPITRETVNASVEADVIARYLQIMENYFKDRCQQRPDQSIFLKGWLRRIESVRKIIGS